jgi:hypothetical protein
MLEIGMTPNIRLLCIEVLVHIYIAVPPRNPKDGLAIRPPWRRSQTAQGGGSQGNPNPGRPLSGKNPNGPGQASRRM